MAEFTAELQGNELIKKNGKIERISGEVRGHLAVALLLTALLAVVRPGSGEAVEGLTLTGTLQIKETQIAFIGSGSLGGGHLNFGGKSYSFKIGGLGVGGIGISKVTATGNVYNLTDLAYFPGAYVQLRTESRSEISAAAGSGCRIAMASFSNCGRSARAWRYRSAATPSTST